MPARWIIVFAQILTVLAGSLAGLAFYFRGIVFPNAVWQVSAGLLLSALFIYPGKGLRGYSYARQKACDFALVVLCFALAGVGMNRFAHSGDAATVVRPTARMIALKARPYLDKSEKALEKAHLKHSLRDRKQQLRSKFRQLRSEFRHAARQPLTKGGKTALIILTVLGVIFLAYVVAGLACSVSCSGGSTALVLLIWIGGWTGLIFLAIWLIRVISRSGASTSLSNLLQRRSPGRERV